MGCLVDLASDGSEDAVGMGEESRLTLASSLAPSLAAQPFQLTAETRVRQVGK